MSLNQKIADLDVRAKLSNWSVSLVREMSAKAAKPLILALGSW